MIILQTTEKYSFRHGSYVFEYVDAKVLNARNTFAFERIAYAVIIEQNQRLAHRGHDFAVQLADGIIVSHVGLERFSAYAFGSELLDELLGTRAVGMIVHGNRCAKISQMQSRGFSNPASASGDQGKLFLKRLYTLVRNSTAPELRTACTGVDYLLDVMLSCGVKSVLMQVATSNDVTG